MAVCTLSGSADLVVATKFGIAHAPDGSAFVRNDADYIRESAEGSLRRLQVDVIDLHYLHRRDPDVPIEDTVGAMAALVKAGQVRYLGLSEVTAGELRAAQAVHPISAVQSEWSLFSRDIERFVVPAAVELGVAMVPYSPLGRGLLTGVTQPFAAGDVRNTMTRFSNADANQALLEPLRVIAQDHEATVAQVALAWVHQRGRGLAYRGRPDPRHPEPDPGHRERRRGRPGSERQGAGVPGADRRPGHRGPLGQPELALHRPRVAR
jgi:aryl-alcohol dehydrogenase-like predicted oxidoreductase